MTGNILEENIVFTINLSGLKHISNLGNGLGQKDSRKASVSYLSTGIQVLRLHRDTVGRRGEGRVVLKEKSKSLTLGHCSEHEN